MVSLALARRLNLLPTRVSLAEIVERTAELEPLAVDPNPAGG